MNYLLMIFRSRNDTLAAYRFFSSRGLNCMTVNAPGSLVKSCGLALKTSASSAVVLGLLNQYTSASTVKVYMAEQSFGGATYRQIY